ncbi:MAG: CoA transferase subunit A [Deltaproteobacteria bacterium]|nr:CoA transferase subunit A [Deltaproteobacteria bacterium]
MPKLFASAAEAIADMEDHCVLMSGGFGLCGNPENLITALAEKGVKGLSIISNNCGTTEQGLGVLLQRGQVAKMTSSYVGENKEFEKQFLTGGLEVELVPQGTLAERIRAGGAGIPAFFTATGVGTQVADGGLPMVYNADGEVVKASEAKEQREIDGRTYALETALHADYTFVRAYKADTMGNLQFRKTARNFSPMMCKAGRITIVEAEHIVEPGEIGPDSVHIPGIYVQRLIQGKDYEKPIEQRTVLPRENA